MSELLSAAREYLSLGLSVIPCGRDKRPLTEWRDAQDELPHADQVDEWWTKWPDANVGVVTGRVSGLVVLDADGPEGLESLKALDPPATTWLSRTGRLEGGWQQFFKHPGDRVIGNRAGLRPHLDVRGDGGYVVVPPSWHASGRRYAWLTSPHDAELAALPANVLELLSSPAPTTVPRAAGDAVIPQGQRNDTLWRIARGLVAKGLSAEAITVALLEENRVHCVPPMPEREVRAIAQHALTHPDRNDFGSANGSPKVPGPILPLGIGLGEFLARDFPQEEPYVDGLLSSDGGGWIGGEEKLGKTFYAVEEALCLALALPVCGRFPVPLSRRVLFIEEEDSPRRTHRRVSALLHGHGLDPTDATLRSTLDAWFRIEVWGGFTFDVPAMVARLEAAVAEFRPSVCYIDVLRKVTLRDLNKAAEAGAILAELDRLRRTYGVLFRILHHYRKAQGFRVGRGSQEIGGSFVLGAWGENSLFFEPIGRKQGAVKVEIQSKDGAPAPGFRLEITSEGPKHAPTVIRLTAAEIADEASADDVLAQAIATLPKSEAAAGKPGVPIVDLAKALKRSDKTIRRALKRLEDAGRVLVTGKMSNRSDLYAVVE